MNQPPYNQGGGAGDYSANYPHNYSTRTHQPNPANEDRRWASYYSTRSPPPTSGPSAEHSSLPYRPRMPGSESEARRLSRQHRSRDKDRRKNRYADEEEEEEEEELSPQWDYEIAGSDTFQPERSLFEGHPPRSCASSEDEDENRSEFTEEPNQRHDPNKDELRSPLYNHPNASQKFDRKTEDTFSHDTNLGAYVHTLHFENTLECAYCKKNPSLIGTLHMEYFYSIVEWEFYGRKLVWVKLTPPEGCSYACCVLSMTIYTFLKDPEKLYILSSAETPLEFETKHLRLGHAHDFLFCEPSYGFVMRSDNGELLRFYDVIGWVHKRFNLEKPFNKYTNSTAQGKFEREKTSYEIAQAFI